jgi:hypothetical protein
MRINSANAEIFLDYIIKDINSACFQTIFILLTLVAEGAPLVSLPFPPVGWQSTVWQPGRHDRLGVAEHSSAVITKMFSSVSTINSLVRQQDNSNMIQRL